MKAISDESFRVLIGEMEKFFNLGLKFKALLRPMLFEVSYKKGNRILNAGSRQKIVWFMLRGLAREIRINPHSFDEKTVWFWFGMDFLYTSPGFFTRAESETTIELLEDCDMVYISYEDWARLKRIFKETEPVTENIRGKHDNDRRMHADDIKDLSTQARYQKHLPVLKELFNRTQLSFIAEFMGMAVDTLGKLRKQDLGLK